jgi:hypothetical protein
MESVEKKIIKWKPMSEYEIEQKAKTVYENIKTQLEAKHHGETVIIEVESGDYFLGKNMLDALKSGKIKHPDGIFYGFRIGYRAYVSYRGGRR